jgi:competence protein ComGC
MILSEMLESSSGFALLNMLLFVLDVEVVLLMALGNVFREKTTC